MYVVCILDVEVYWIVVGCVNVDLGGLFGYDLFFLCCVIEYCFVIDVFYVVVGLCIGVCVEMYE